MVALVVKKRWFKVVFQRDSKDSMAVFTTGLNSQAAIANACETLLTKTGEDYRRVPSVAYELDRSWVKQ